MPIGTLVQQITSTPFKARRRLVALVGTPASGKSTLAEQLSQMIPQAKTVPMDGFHLDNSILAARGLSARKGSPDSFDVQGLRHLVGRLAQEDEVVFPLFDRRLDRSIAGAGVVSANIETVIVEGNYLLLDRLVWRELAADWDISIQLTTTENTLKNRLLDRWRTLGLSQDDAARKVEGNDLPNAQLILNESLTADIKVPSEG